MEEAQSYWRHVSNIMVNTQVELAASAEAQFRQRRHDTQAFVDTVANNAPAGSEAAVSALQSAVTAASDATSATIEASKKAAGQAREVAESNVNSAASASNGPAKQAVEQVKAAQENESSSTRIVDACRLRRMRVGNGVLKPLTVREAGALRHAFREQR
jgi:hypothetical protein